MSRVWTSPDGWVAIDLERLCAMSTSSCEKHARPSSCVEGCGDDCDGEAWSRGTAHVDGTYDFVFELLDTEDREAWTLLRAAWEARHAPAPAAVTQCECEECVLACS